MDSWIGPVYDGVALYGALLSIYVMQQTEHDKINRVDPVWLQWLRRAAFIAVALVLCYSIGYGSWEPSLTVLLLVVAGVANLTVNALALHLRAAPGDEAGHRPVSSLWRRTNL